MESFKDRLGNDGTFRDLCKNYGANCGSCFQQIDGSPDCYEAFKKEEETMIEERKALTPWKRPSPAQEFARKRNWAKFIISNMKFQARNLANPQFHNHPVTDSERALLRLVQTHLDIVLESWEARTVFLKEAYLVERRTRKEAKNERKT